MGSYGQITVVLAAKGL